MNKQLITTYFEEFKHWLNGGKLQAKFVNDPWEEASKDIFSYSMVNFILVIDDEYVEFRKALAEGKTIQYYNDSFMKWQDCINQISPSRQFLVHPTKYRIKPEVPKFKVGDWITDGIEVWQHKENCRVKNQINWNLWQPQPGEWCWYSKWDKIVCVEFYLCKFVLDMNEVEPEFKHKYEPFIGELPTFLKENT